MGVQRALRVTYVSRRIWDASPGTLHLGRLIWDAFRRRYFGVGVKVHVQLLFCAFITMDFPSGVTANGPPADIIFAMTSISGSGGA